MPSKFKEKMEKGFSNFLKDPLGTVDLHVNSGLNKVQFYWNSKIIIYNIDICAYNIC